MILHYLKVAVRSLMKFKMQNIIAIFGLAMSLFCFSVCLYCSRYIFSTDDCFRNKDRIVELYLERSDNNFSSITSGSLPSFLRGQGLNAKAFCGVAFPDERSYNIEVSEDKLLPYDLMFMETDSCFNEVFTPEILHGSWKKAMQNPNSVILFESTAKRIFGSAEKSIGKRMVLNRRLYTSPNSTPREGGINYVIQAVAKDLPLNNSLNFLCKTDALAINDTEGQINDRNLPVMAASTFALVEDAGSVQSFIKELDDRKLDFEIFNEKRKVSGGTFGTYFWSGEGVALYFANITLIAGILVLVVGLLNFFHFIIGSFLIRVKECNIRRVNGAGFKDMFLMFFVQISVSIFLSAFVTYLIIELLSPFLSLTLVRFSIVIDPYLLMWQTFTYLIGIMVLCMVISLFVIVKVRRSFVTQKLNTVTGRYGRHRLRNLSLGMQLFISLIFISFATALYMQSVNTNNSVFGTLSKNEKERILSVPLDYSFMDNNTKKTLIDKFKRCPGVEDIIISDINYLQGVSGTGLFLTEKRENYVDANVMRVSPSFFRFMNIGIISGNEQKTLDEMIIDEVLAKRISKDIQLGKVLYDYNKGYTLVGISAPFVSSNYSGRELNGFMFVPSDFSDYIGHCYVKCSANRLEEAVSSIKSVMKDALPESIELSIPTMMDDIYEEHALEFKLRGIVLFMSIIALIISVLGIYSAITLDTEYRRKEMAIRKINGAGVRQIVLIFARLYIVLVIVTVAIAFPIVEFLLRMFSNMYYSFIDTGILFYGGILLFVVLLITLTVYVRIKNIARINPAEIIKSE
ncbi:FtsX-like permease family protein [Bacteroides caecigallinarum]|uniref:FtsX-like permease family protein n=1 Tax=Bacteroides caecigallinarum TaxID=1411144 RepID=UPI001F2D50A2|nr:FtsX-like permease family protein [Bacteroides caecigallinarum]MCF2581697.1 ABC transporter permease [Bacteroides caecigallinarum]